MPSTTINRGLILTTLIDRFPPAPASATVARPRVAASPAPDEALMLRYRDGDDAAFRELYARYRGPLTRFARSLCANGAEAEEVFQDTWIAVIRARARYAVHAKFVTWLFAIAHRRAADGRRARARHPMVSWNEPDHAPRSELTAEPPALAAEQARQQALRRAIAALPFEQREVFLLRAETGLDLRAIATITRAPAETTKSRLRYALRELRKAMAPWK